ncbi:hypothetical protein SAMN04487965_2954 [Microbulbifer donghaiensis]|uniref:Nucleotide modification associated domain-containing protein n=1 Tax=Microbulbifer donghaiensis TaxID=494016 RepID=A0A1M5FKI2_9GAMM|nr:hypothetical protein [Microbulbifer donghaiensis]SHF91995.1 hypothetical protein SAMN04487965_2954 [Microbulbifer donghaiensis]
MRLILSRKGFDSSAGGCPSPIFPDGSLYALPIPDSNSRIQYGDINRAGDNGDDIGALVEDLTRGKITADMGAHLDPDMHTDALPRRPDWRPLLGQTGAAQGHLRKQGVGAGDLFLFFGLFRLVERIEGRWRFVKNAPARHILWGWLAIDQIVKVDALPADTLSWARYHPHFAIGPDAANTLYLAAERFRLAENTRALAGAGTFPRVNPRLVLTHPDSPKPTAWRLPGFLYPEPGRTPLSYHNKLERWSRDLKRDDGDHCQLQCAARGQEFVLNMDEYPQASPWISGLITQLGC